MTALQELLGIELPIIIDAPMAGMQGSALVAVSNAGGLGSLPAAMLTRAALRVELAAVRAGTSGPCNLSFFCHLPPEPSRAASARRAGAKPWRRTLPSTASTRARSHRAPAALLSMQPRQTSSKSCATRSSAFISVCPRPRARARARHGRQGTGFGHHPRRGGCGSKHTASTRSSRLEAGGHRGNLSNDLSLQLGTFALVPQLATAVRCPVIAAGGIADARGVAAALALGASGVQVGTAYLLCPEATTAALHRQMLASDAARVTAVTNLFTGPARGIVNRSIRDLGPMSPVVPEFPLATTEIAALRAKARPSPT